MKRFLSLLLAMVMIMSLVPATLISTSAAQIALYWPLPVDKVAIGRITSAFGPRTAPTSGASTNHRGIDLPAPSGTPVYAAFDGEVTAIGKTNARGNYVVIYHPLVGLSTLYQHLTCATVQLGETVVGGTQVAISGNTGVGTGAHLHFGVMVGKATNPNHDQPAYNMAMDPLHENILYVAASGGTAQSGNNPDDYSVPTRDLSYTSPVMTGTDVKWVQSVLFQLGYTIGIDGSFGPATKSVVQQFQTDYGLTANGIVDAATRTKLADLWNYKKNGNVTVELHSWLSNTAYGEDPNGYYVSDTLYLNYELIDASTGLKINTLTSKTYTVVMAFFNPDGSVHNTVTLANSDSGTLTGVPAIMGTYLAAVAVVGDIALNSEIYFQAVYNTKMTLSPGSISLDLTGTNTVTATLSLTGAYPAIRGVFCEVNPPIATATLGTAWDGGNIPITVTATEAGNATLTLSLVEGDTGTISTIASIDVPITVSAPSYTVSYNANGGSGAPSAQTKTYGKALTLSSTVPTRSGYSFKGWATSSTATTAAYQPGASYNTDASLALYAVWEQNIVLSSVSVQTAPTKTTYYTGEAFDGSGLVLKLTYSDGSTKTITSGFTFSGFDSAAAGTKTVTVSYSGKTAAFNVTVKAPSISLSKNNLTMSTGSTVPVTATTDPAGQTVTWSTSDSTVATVNSGHISAKKNGIAVITASFTYNGVTYTKSCSVTVNCSHKNTTTHPADPSTCTVQGHGEYVTCNDCGITVSGSAEKLPFADHTGGTATCKSGAACAACGAVYTSPDYNNHTGGTELRGAAAPTETADGYTGDTYCLGCDQKLADGEVIPMLPPEDDDDGYELVIPAGTTVIDASRYAFRGDITSVVIPEGVTEIGTGAFAFCENLKKVVLPSTLENIGKGAFAFCDSLTDITIPEGVTEIGTGAFNCCISLGEIYIPDGVSVIGEDVFEGCTEVTLRFFESAPAASYAEEYGVNYRVILRGDVDDNGTVNSSDVTLLGRNLAGADVSTDYGADYNRDGVVNSSDLIILRRKVAGADV